MTAWTAAASTSNWGVAWFADMGAYAGPDALDAPAVRPADASEVQFWVGYMVGDPATTGAFTGNYATSRRWLNTGTEYSSGDSMSGEGVDLSSARLFVVWYDPDAPSDPADLTAPSVTPDSLVPDSYVAAPPSGSASVVFGGLSARVTTSDRPTAALYDTDGSFLCALPLAAGIQWQEELSAVGALSMRLPLDDAATLLATSRRILKVSWRGQERQAARIDSSSTDVAVDGRVWREWSNLPGIMSILGGVTVYPEYGLNRASNTTRTFGYMSKTGHGEWLSSGNWTPAIGVTWAAMTGDRAGFPTGLDLPNPQWIGKRGPNADEPPLSYQYFRRRWTTSAGMNVRILATGDNYLDLWLDGEKIVDSTGQHQFTWRDSFQSNVHIPPGVHVLAARVRNHKDTTYSTNRMGLLFTMQRVQSNGDVIDEPPFINSDFRWLVSDITPGFRRSEVLHRLWGEGSSYGYTSCDLLPLGFSRTYDSAGVAWEEPSGEYTVDVGSSLLDVIAALSEKNIDINVDPDTLEVQAWVRRGSDKTAAVQLRLGRDGGNLIGHRVDTTEPRYNTILMQLADGRWTQRQDAASVAAHGREGGGLAMGSTTSTSTANQTADAQLLEASERSAAFTTQISSQIGPQPYIDFGMGDTITAPDENTTGAYATRLMAVTAEAPDDGSPVKLTLELMLDRSATPATYADGGAGTSDPGDLEADGTSGDGSSTGGSGSDTGSGGASGGGSGSGGSAAYSTLVFSDTFANLSNWNVRTEAEGGGRLGYDLPANVTIQSDGLHITAKNEAHGGRAFTTGYIDTIGKHSWSTGRWEFDMRLPTAPALWPAAWLRCDSSGGEIDVLEAIGGLPDMVVQTVHQDTSGTGDRSGFEWHGGGSWDPTALHTYSVERDSDGAVRWYVDDLLTRTVAPGDISTKNHVAITWLGSPSYASPLNIRLNLQVGGSMPTYYGKSIDPATLPDVFVIQAVRVYA